MNYRPQRETEAVEAAVPASPKECSIFGCTRHTDILTTIVEKDGRQLAGAFGDFGFSRHTDAGTKLVLHPQYRFVGWVSRCANHHLRDLDGVGKSIIFEAPA